MAITYNGVDDAEAVFDRELGKAHDVCNAEGVLLKW
jgi:hypothetical protein